MRSGYKELASECKRLVEIHKGLKVLVSHKQVHVINA